MRAPGHAFGPQDHALFDNFLRPKIDGRPLPVDASFIHDADVCATAPGELARMFAPTPVPVVRQGWYFFSPAHDRGDLRWSRRHATGCWRPENKLRKVKDGDGFRYMHQLSYEDHRSAAASGAAWKQPEWLMVEYGFTQGRGSSEKLVLCMVYRSLRAKP